MWNFSQVPFFPSIYSTMVQPKAALPMLPCSNTVICPVSVMSILSFSTKFTHAADLRKRGRRLYWGALPHARLQPPGNLLHPVISGQEDYETFSLAFAAKYFLFSCLYLFHSRTASRRTCIITGRKNGCKIEGD